MKKVINISSLWKNGQADGEEILLNEKYVLMNLSALTTLTIMRDIHVHPPEGICGPALSTKYQSHPRLQQNASLWLVNSDIILAALGQILLPMGVPIGHEKTHK